MDIATGTAKTSHILGIGGNRQDALAAEAKRDLMINTRLKDDEYFSNFITDIKVTQFTIYSRTKVTVTADIMCTRCDTVQGRYSECYLAKINPVTSLLKDLAVSDTSRSSSSQNLPTEVWVPFGNSYVQGKITQVPAKNKITVVYVSAKGEEVTKTLSAAKVFYSAGKFNKYSVGDRVAYKSYNSETGRLYHHEGVIKGINSRYALIPNDKGTFQMIRLVKIERIIN